MTEAAGDRPPKRLSPDEEQASITAWTYRSRNQGPDSYWCTPDEAAALLGCSASRVRQLVSRAAPVLPAVVVGRRRLMLLRRAEVAWAAEHAGPAGALDRWEHVRAVLTGGTSRPERRPTARSAEIAALPWEQIAADYQAGVTVAALASRHHVSTGVVLNRLRSRGVWVRKGFPRRALALSDVELRARHDDGATLAQLAATCQVSVGTIWRRVQLGPPARQQHGPGQPLRSRTTEADEQAMLAAWTYADYRSDPEPYWTTATDAARLLELSRERIRQLIGEGVLVSARTAAGRTVVRAGDVTTLQARLERDQAGLRWRDL